MNGPAIRYHRAGLEPGSIIFVFCALVAAGSMLGGWLPSRIKLSHAHMQVVISFVAGLMLGVALFHMLPHSAAYTASLDETVAWMVGGLLGMFFLIRAFHFHDHAHGQDPGDHDHGHAHAFSWAGVAFGLAVHTIIDGIALGAAVLAESKEGLAVAGLGTFLAVALHKPLDAFSIASLMRASGWTTKRQLLVNLGFALMVPVGALLFFFGVGEPGPAVGRALGFSAGVFLCISLADLLPEVQFHSHDRWKLSIALLLGVALAYGIGLLEGEHLHSH